MYKNGAFVQGLSEKKMNDLPRDIYRVLYWKHDREMNRLRTEHTEQINSLRKEHTEQINEAKRAVLATMSALDMATVEEK